MSIIPDDLVIIGGTWDTDVSFVGSTSGDPAPSGDGYLHFLATTSAVDKQAWSPSTSTYFSIQSGRCYVLRSVMRASSIAAGNYVQARAVVEDWASHQVDVNAFYGELAAINTWYTKEAYFIPPVGYTRILTCVLKKNNAFTADFDSCEVLPAKISFRAYDDTTTALTAGGYTTITLAHESHDHGGVFAANTFTAPYPCRMQFTGKVTAESLADTKIIIPYLLLNGVACSCGTSTPGGAAGYHRAIVSDTLYLATGDTIQMGCYNGDASNRNTTASETETYLAGFEV